MPRGESAPSGGRRVVAACAVPAWVLAVVVPLLSPQQLALLYAAGSFGGVSAMLLAVLAQLPALLPPALALVAVVLTRVPWVGVVLAGVAAVLASVTGVVVFLGRGVDLGPLDAGGWVLSSVLGAVPLLVADLRARRGPFTWRTGLETGALVAMVTVVLRVGPVLLAQGSLALELLPAAYWLSVVLAPVLVLVGTGAAAGAAVERRGSGS